VNLHHRDALGLLRSLPDESVDLITTDPAYSGMNRHLELWKGRIVGEYSERGEGGKWFQEFEDTPENYRALLLEMARVLRKDRHVYVMFDPYSLLTLAPLVREFFAVKNLVTWDKVAMGMGHYHRRRSEFILFGCKGKRKLSSRAIPDVWRIRRLHRAGYPTQKPVELFEAMIAASVHAEDFSGGVSDFLVCDPFMGVGTCAVAAMRQGVQFVGCDVSREAVELARRRVESWAERRRDPLQEKAAWDDSMMPKWW